MKSYKQFLIEMDEPPLDKKTYSPKEIAEKHKVSVQDIFHQLNIGDKVEKEHTHSPRAAREIALDHLWEKPDYYTKLKKMEKSK